MAKKQMSNKTLLIILGSIVLVAVILLVVLNAMKNSEGNLKLRCEGTHGLQGGSLERKVEIYEKGGDLIYIENQKYIFDKPSKEEIVFLKNKFQAYFKEYKKMDYLKIDMQDGDNFVLVKIKVNISEVQRDEEFVLLNGEISLDISELESKYVRDGYTCKSY